MEENNEVLEQEADITEEDQDAFGDWSDDSDDDWTEILTEAVADEPEQDAQPEDGEDNSGDDSVEAEEQGTQTEAGNQRFKIHYLGNEEELTLEQMTELAQKGRDYDHVRQERDKLKDESGRQLDFLKKLADKAGVSVDEQIDLTEAMWLMDEEAEKGNTISEAEALLRIQRDRGKPADAKGKADQSDVPQGFNEQVDRFLKVYPKVTGDQIPQEVWDETRRNGGDLLVAYQNYRIKTLEAENAKAKQTEQNNKNSKRSTGSLSSAGANKKRDAFDEGWDSDD